MGLFETALRELGARVAGPFLPFAREHGSAEALAEHLATWPTWSDASPYGGETVPFFKRAQIAAADLALAGLIADRDLAGSRSSPTTSSRTCCASTACSPSTTGSSPASRRRS